MSRAEDDAHASTFIQGGTPTVGERPASHSGAELGAGAMIGRYQLVARLGAGAMGVVWSAHDPQLDRRVAVKLVHPTLARSLDASSRLLREARAMAKVSHRAVITVHDAGDVDGQLFLAMELVPGVTLGAMLRGRDAAARADWRRWLSMMLEAGRGLAAAHAQNVLHRDFKPDNVLVDASGRVCVGDFGLAMLGDSVLEEYAGRRSHAAIDLTESGPHVGSLTMTGTLLGTPAYMSPQQLRAETIDARADQFAFCVTLYEALHGTRPFTITLQGLDALPALVEAIESGQLPIVPTDSTVPAELRAIVKRGLAADPDARWPDMPTLLQALEQASKLEPSPATVPVAAASPRRRSRGWLFAGIAAAIAGAIVVAMLQTGQPAAPAVAPLGPKPQRTLTFLFTLASNANIGISPDATRLAIGTDRLEVRDLTTSQVWTKRPLAFDTIGHVELDADHVRYGLHRGGSVFRWDYATTNEIRTEVEDLGGRWFGRAVCGDLMITQLGKARAFCGGRELPDLLPRASVDVYSLSPDKRRFAYLDASKFTGVIVIYDLVRRTQITTSDLPSPTALAWSDDSTLLYATGTDVRPVIHSVRVRGDTLGEPTEVFSLEKGWFGQIVAARDRILLQQLVVSSRTRVITRSATGVPEGAPEEYDRSTASASLGWLPTGELLTWNRSTLLLEVTDASRVGSATLLESESEPANATLAGDTLIVAVRLPQGRRLVASSLTTGVRLWRRDNVIMVVRCAGDAHPPCFAIRSDGKREQVVSVDPATGELGTKVLFEGSLQDIAVNDDGKRILVGGAMSQIIEIDPEGTVIQSFKTNLSTVRSLAYDPKMGGILAGGALSRNVYEVGQLGAGRTYATITRSVNDLFFLVRPSPDGRRVVLLARVYAPELWQLN